MSARSSPAMLGPRALAGERRGWIAAWIAVIGAAAGVRIWNALTGSLMWGYDAWGHVAYVLFLDLYRAVPFADQGWSYYQPPLHYALGWVLAQFHDGNVLMRGLCLLASAASLGTAGIAAWLTREISPERPGLALLAFCAVAFLPVQFYMSQMPGNEMSLSFLNAAALAAFIANERREYPTLFGDSFTGMLLGLALLTKHNGFLAVAVVGASLLVRIALSPLRRREIARVAARGGVLLLPILVIAGPHYLRNVTSYGTLIPSNRDYALVSTVEAEQPPGVRSWRDYVRFTPRQFTDPNPLAPHMLHSIWGSLYMNVWAETHRESDRGRALEAELEVRRSTTLMGILGLLPTALAAWGGFLAVRDVRAGRRRAEYVPLLLLTTAMILAFGVFVWKVPIWAAVKASYCLSLSLPYAVFMARGTETLLSRPAMWRRMAPFVAVGGAAVAASLIAVSGAVLPRRDDAPATGAVHFYFGEYEDARRVYGQYLAKAAYQTPWLDNLASVELADGHVDRARRLYARAVSLAEQRGLADPYRQGRLAVAASLDGDLDGARRLLDEVLAERDLPELLANRGAIRAVQGDPAGAVEELRAALAIESGMVPAWLNLARLLERLGRGEEAGRALIQATRRACLPPRGYPYGVGTGEVLEWGVGRRPLLLLEQGKLRATTPDFYRHACERLAAPASSAAR